MDNNDIRLEVLVSAMNQHDLSLVDQLGCESDILIVNQSDFEGYTESTVNGYLVRMISTKQRGLSRSRNMALAHSTGDICLFCDDDEVLHAGYGKTIIDAFSRLADADIIAFNFENENPHFSPKIIKTESRSSRFRFNSSVSLAFRRKRIQAKGIWFDVCFGAGSGFISMGEESIWQREAQKKGLKRFLCPCYIASVKQEESSWFRGYDAKYFYDLGAFLERGFPILKYLFRFYYLYRLGRLTKLSAFDQMKWINNGMKGFRKGMSYQEFVI